MNKICDMVACTIRRAQDIILGPTLLQNTNNNYEEKGPSLKLSIMSDSHRDQLIFGTIFTEQREGALRQKNPPRWYMWEVDVCLEVMGLAPSHLWNFFTY